jgi:hypothetical protein
MLYICTRVGTISLFRSSYPTISSFRHSTSLQQVLERRCKPAAMLHRSSPPSIRKEKNLSRVIYDMKTMNSSIGTVGRIICTLAVLLAGFAALEQE